jgi:hypothetical protein
MPLEQFPRIIVVRNVELPFGDRVPPSLRYIHAFQLKHNYFSTPRLSFSSQIGLDSEFIIEFHSVAGVGEFARSDPMVSV